MILSFQENLSNKFSADKIDNMTNVALKMERPLENAFGENWRKIFTTKEIELIYKNYNYV